MILADLDHPGSESADQRRAHRNRGHQHRRIEESTDRKVGELFHTFIVNEPRARFDEVRGCFNGGVVPTPPKRGPPIIGVLTSTHRPHSSSNMRRVPALEARVSHLTPARSAVRTSNSGVG
jgi:hypothetical protein